MIGILIVTMILCIFIIFIVGMAFLDNFLSSDWYPYTRGQDLPERGFEYLVIDKKGGIGDLCRIGQDSNSAIENLGKPDSFESYLDPDFLIINLNPS